MAAPALAQAADPATAGILVFGSYRLIWNLLRLHHE